MKRRSSGILLHISSLPSPFGIGDLGPSAYRFVDFLFETRQTLWQILPLNPTDLACHNSPYHSSSAFAFNPLLISPEFLVSDGLLSPSDLEPLPSFDPECVDFHRVTGYKQVLYHHAFERFQKRSERRDYDRFLEENAYWLRDFALFASLKKHYPGKMWSEWPEEIRDRKPSALQEALRMLRKSVGMEEFLQFLSFKQWRSLKAYCEDKGVKIVGDIPIYAVLDSADLWVHPELFNLDEQKMPVTVAGVPPDYFSETGQLWGNPVYGWDALKQSGYDWWFRKIAHSLTLYDFIRIDHFRGLVAYWQVGAGEKNAIRGEWVHAPAMDFFDRLTSKFPGLPLIAEDLGTITQDVRDVMDRFEIPGMKVLLFAFSGKPADNPYLPHNYTPHCVVYTGTHDNNTTRGWFENELKEEELKTLFQYLGKEPPPEEIHWDLIRLAMMSVAEMAIFPLQDVLGLGPEARMNRPATKDRNWQWRFSPGRITDPLRRRLEEMTELYGRQRNENE